MIEPLAPGDPITLVNTEGDLVFANVDNGTLYGQHGPSVAVYFDHAIPRRVFFRAGRAFLGVRDEGVRWCRGHSGPALDALRAFCAL